MSHMAESSVSVAMRIVGAGVVIALLIACRDGGGPKADSAHGPGATTSAPASVPQASPQEAATLAPPPSAALSSDVASAEQASIRRLPAGGAHDLVLGNCLTCHSATMIEQQHKDSAGWTKTVGTMISWGAPVPAAQQPELVAYLTRNFPARAVDAPPRVTQ